MDLLDGVGQIFLHILSERCTKYPTKLAGIIYQFVPEYYKPWNEHSLLILTDSADYKQFIWSDNYCVGKHNSFCKDSPNCRYHILLCFQEPHKVFEKINHLHFKYTTVSDLYSFYLLYIHDTLVERAGDVTESLQRAIQYFKNHPDFIRQPSVLRKKVARKVIKSHNKSNSSKSVGTQTVDEQFQKRVASILEGRYASEFFRIVDALVDHHGTFETPNILFCVKK